MSKYIIIDADAIQKRIDNLDLIINDGKPSGSDYIKLKLLKQILSQSTPLIPEIEKAFDAGSDYGKADALFWCTEYEAKQDKEDYISNLKLDI